MLHVVSDTTDSKERFCIEALAIEPRVFVDGIWIPAPDTRVKSLQPLQSLVRQMTLLRDLTLW